MRWLEAIIENSEGHITEKNINKFIGELLSILVNQHNGKLPDGTYVEFKVEIYGLELMGHYYAKLTDWSDKTEPDDVVLDYIDNVLVS